MIFLLFPTMGELTRSLIEASIFILSNKSRWLPILANLITFITKNIRFAPKVLPIVSINTLWFIMIFVKWTPFSFEIEHVKVSIHFHFMNKPCLQLHCTMCKWTIISIFTLIYVLGIFCTIPWFVLFWVIHTFNTIIGYWASQAFITFLSRLLLLTQIWRIQLSHPLLNLFKASMN